MSQMTLQRLLDFPSNLHRMNNGTLHREGTNSYATYRDDRRGIIVVTLDAYEYAVAELAKMNEQK